jgi:DNA-binding LacI/PurR family transcriptional regulator
MQAAADDLGIHLTVHYADRNHILMKTLVREALKDTESYLIFVDEKSVITNTLINSTHIHPAIIFLLNQPDDEQTKRLIKKGYGILGSLLPDNFQAGKLLAHKLVSLINKPAKSERTQMIALLGESATLAAQEREQGLLNYSNRKPQLTLKQRVAANWSYDGAFERTLGLLKRFPNTKLIWCANDAMAFGAAAALSELGIRDKVKVGGINWEKGQHTQLDTSIGGHVTLGGLAMVQIFNHQQLNSIPIGNQIYPIFEVYSEEYAPIYKAINNKNIDNIDFLRFTSLTEDALEFNLKALNSFFK